MMCCHLFIVVQSYSLAVIGYRVATFNDCAAAAEELKHVSLFHFIMTLLFNSTISGAPREAPISCYSHCGPHWRMILQVQCLVTKIQGAFHWEFWVAN